MQLKENLYDRDEIAKVRTELDSLFDDPIQQVTDGCHISKSTVSRYFNFHRVKPTSALTILMTCYKLIFRAKRENNKLLRRYESDKSEP